jgi:two-component system sensor histidine kinase UhpB
LSIGSPSALLGSSSLVSDAWPLDDGRLLRIALDPYDEIEEIQDSLLQLLLLSAFALILSLLTIRFAVHRARRVLDELLAGLRKVGAGHFDTRLRDHGLSEARHLAAHFNDMATTPTAGAGGQRRADPVAAGAAGA